jgi:DNA repair protein RecN (Recombination protein N)
MLLELTIRDFAIIHETRISFEPGFNVLTGETGAGKSILIDALGAVLGERTGSDVVRTGARAARVEALFDVTDLRDRTEFRAALDESGVDSAEEQLVLSREISAAGRTVARVNGRTTTASILSRLGGFLVDIHGQSDHLSLLRPAEQLDMLDRFAGTVALRASVATRVEALRAIERQIRDLTTNARERAQRIDLLEFQVGEIERAELIEGEEEDLLAERRILSNSGRLAEDVAEVQALISGGDDDFGEADPLPAALPALRQAIGAMAQVAQIDPSAGDLDSRLNEVVVLLGDLAAELRVYRDGIDSDPGRLIAVEERLDLIKTLRRKYGATITEILETGQRAAAELETLTGTGADVEELQSSADRLRAEAGQLATELSGLRSTAGDRLGAAIEQAMTDLNMGRARFAVSIDQTDSASGVQLGPEGRRVAVDGTGVDRVVFLLASNAGEQPKPVARVASGGETARLMLALKSILSAADETPTLVFDEVDVGVGGRSGQVVGEKLWGLERDHQVIVITHLPQIAAFGEAHFRIAKADVDGRVVSRVDVIANADRVDELAAMLDGLPVTPVSRLNAESMLERVDRWKAGHGLDLPART